MRAVEALAFYRKEVDSVAPKGLFDLVLIWPRDLHDNLSFVLLCRMFHIKTLKRLPAVAMPRTQIHPSALVLLR